MQWLDHNGLLTKYVTGPNLVTKIVTFGPQNGMAFEDGVITSTPMGSIMPKRRYGPSFALSKAMILKSGGKRWAEDQAGR